MAEQFKDSEFMSAEEKRKVIKAWERFLKSDFKKGNFTEALYEHLMQHCSFIAHYNRHGFFQHYFSTPHDENTRKFIRQFSGDVGRNSAEYGSLGWGNSDYHNLNTEMVRVMKEHSDRLMALANSSERYTDLRLAGLLMLKHDINPPDELEPYIKKRRSD